MKTTLTAIRRHFPCIPGWHRLLKALGKTHEDEESLGIRFILDSNGFDDALWCLRAVEGEDRNIRLYAVWCARQVEHLMQDSRSKQALTVAERYARWEATAAELEEARVAAHAVWVSLVATLPVARDTAHAVRAATATALTPRASWVAAWEAAYEAREALCAWVVQEAELRRVLDCLDAGQDPYPKLNNSKENLNV